MPVPLFVYGTLSSQSAGKRHRLLRKARCVAKASMVGELYDLGRYPGVVRNGRTRRRVFGELYELPDVALPRALEELDRYEGPEFARKRVYLTLGDGSRRVAWAYLLRKRPPKGARELISGRYRAANGAA